MEAISEKIRYSLSYRIRDKAGAPVALIQSLVGHVNARMVRHYTHITTGAARNAVEMLDSEPILEQLASKTAVQLELQF